MPLAGLLITLGFLALYLGFSPPGLVSGDSTELIYGLEHFQTVHPPGYPLYLVLGRALLGLSGVPAVPGGHWLSGLYGTLTLGGLFVFLRCRDIRLLPALGTVTFLGFSYPFWSLAVRAEVYTLLALLFVASLLLWWTVRQGGSGRRLLWLIAGLHLAHHPLGILGVLLAVDATRASGAPFRLEETGLLLLPGSLYFLLLVPGTGFPFNWPEIGNLPTLWGHMTGGSFARFLKPTDVSSLLVQGQRILMAHLAAFPGLFLILFFLGYRNLTQADRVLVFLQVGLILLLGIYSVPDVVDFLLPSFLLGAWFIARAWNRWEQSLGVAATVLIALLGIGSLVGMGRWAGLRYDWRDHQFPREYIQTVQGTLQSGVVLSDWSHYTLLRFAQLMGKQMKNVYLPTPTHRYESWAKRIRYHHRRGHRVYVTHDDWPRPPDFELERHGYLFQVHP